MFAVLLALLLALPFIEIWVAIKVAGVIGAPATMLAIVAMSVVGWYLMRGEGTSVWRRATTEISAGRTPARELLDGAMVLVGGICLILPGFVTGVFGLLLLLPPIRSLLRPLMSRWMTTRAERLAGSGRVNAVMVDTVVDAQGRVRTRTRTMGDVIDAEGWDVGGQSEELPVADHHDRVIEGHIVDSDATEPDAG